MDLEIGLGEFAGGAHSGRLCAAVDMAAVKADPQGVFIPLEYLARLDIVRQLFEALLVPLFDFSHQLEGGGNVLEALLPGGFPTGCPRCPA